MDVNQPLEDGDTVLMFAAMEGYLDIVKTLLEAGVDAKLISYQGDNALVQAVLGGWQEVFEYLILDKLWAEIYLYSSLAKQFSWAGVLTSFGHKILRSDGLAESFRANIGNSRTLAKTQYSAQTNFSLLPRTKATTPV